MLPPAQASDLRIQILEGEGASHRTGSVAYTGATVRIVDTTGTPIPGAMVTFRLPAGGVTGAFANGGLAEEVIADGEGKASVWGIRWGMTPGTTNISITAKVGALTAGTAVRVQVVPASGSAAARTPAPRQKPAERPPGAGFESGTSPPQTSAPQPVAAPEAATRMAAARTAGFESGTLPTPASAPQPLAAQRPVPPPQPVTDTPATTSQAASVTATAPTPEPSFETAIARPVPGTSAPKAPLQGTSEHSAEPVNCGPSSGGVCRALTARNMAPQPSFEIEVAPRTGAADPGAVDRSSLVAVGGGEKAGVILGPTLEPVGHIDGPRSKWLWIGLGVAGAIGAGFAYRMLQQRAPVAPAATTVAPTLSLGQPTITIGKP